MPKKLKDFHQAVLDQLKLSKTKFETNLAEIQSDDFTVEGSVRNAKRRRKEWSYCVDALDRDIEKNRAAMIDPSLSPADIEGLAEEIRLLLIKRRGGLSVINEENRIISELDSLADNISTRLENLKQSIDRAGIELELASSRDERHQEWLEKLVEASLTGLKANANQVLTAADGAYKLAQARVDGDIPEKLRDRAQERIGNVFDLNNDTAVALNSLNSNLDDKSQADNGVVGAIGEKLTAYNDAADVLADLVVNGPQTLETARSILTEIVNSEDMTASQVTRVNALVNAAGVDTHFDLEETRNEKQHQVDETRQLLLAAEARLRADNPDISDADVTDHATVKPLHENLYGNDSSDGFEKELQDANDALGFSTHRELKDAEVELSRLQGELTKATIELKQREPDADPATHPDLAAHRTAVSDQTTVVSAKLAAFKAVSWYQLEEMEVAIPESIWGNLKQLLEGKRLLVGLNTLPTNLNDIKDALETAEDDLVTTLEAEDKSNRGFEYLAREIALLGKRVRWLSNRRQSQLFDASRGLD